MKRGASRAIRNDCPTTWRIFTVRSQRMTDTWKYRFLNSGTTQHRSSWLWSDVANLTSEYFHLEIASLLCSLQNIENTIFLKQNHLLQQYVW